MGTRARQKKMTQEGLNLEEKMENGARQEEMEEEEISLHTMPVPAFEQILKHCDYRGINALRKTCHRTRRLVDAIKPDPRVHYFKFFLSPGTIEMWLGFGYLKLKQVVYKNQNGGCLISIDRIQPVVFFENTSAEELFRQDLKILLPMLKRQKKSLHYCDIVLQDGGFPIFQTTIAELMAEFEAQFPTEILTLIYSELPDITSILRLVSAKTLTYLHIEDANRRFEELDLTRVAEMDQWNNLRILVLEGCLVDDLSRLAQISRSDIEYDTIEPHTVAALKEMFLKSPTFKECAITLREHTRRQDRILRKQIVRAFPGTDVRSRHWDFPTPTPEYVLRISVNYFMTFTRIRISELEDSEDGEDVENFEDGADSENDEDSEGSDLD